MKVKIELELVLPERWTDANKDEIAQNLWDLLIVEPRCAALDSISKTIADPSLSAAAHDAIRNALIAVYKDNAELLSTARYLSLELENDGPKNPE